MARIKMVTFGGDRATIRAGANGYAIAIPGTPCLVKTRAEMKDLICEIRGDLTDILFELDRAYGVFKDIEDVVDDEEEEVVNEDE